MTPSNTFDYPTQPGLVLTPHETRTRYFDELRLQAEDGRNLVVPTLFATVVYERGADPDVRQALVQCFVSVQPNHVDAAARAGLSQPPASSDAAATPRCGC